MSLTKAELLVLTQKSEPLVLKEGEQVVLSDISLPVSAQTANFEVVRKLGEFF